ncbi:MAG: multicopper oxidase domain-containing protein [Gemmatimonadota bacterium]
MHQRPQPMNRRDWLRLGAAGVAGLSGATVLSLARRSAAGASLGRAGIRSQEAGEAAVRHDPHGMEQLRMGVYGNGTPADGFDPVRYLTEFDGGRIVRGPRGETVREYEIIALDREIEVAPGVWFPAWTYNGRVPGPTIRCREGDRIRVRFRNAGSHPHTIHFHGIHPPGMDGVEPVVAPGEKFTYEFEALPWGLHLYHCHAIPLKRHIHKGLYGAFIVDPPDGRSPARELVMVMNGFDTNFDGENEIYAVNTAAFFYRSHPVRVGVGEPVRVYLVNLTEFDLINSFHLHAAMFRVFRTGTRPEAHEITDTVMLCQGERHILEFELGHPGLHMFHAHQSEFAELGWMGFFDAVENLAADDGVPVHRYG